MHGGSWHCTGVVIKTVTKEKCKKANWLSEEALQILRKGDKQKIRRKGKIYPSECRVPKNRQEREESLLWWSMQRNRGKNRKGKTRGLFRKIRDTKTFHAKMGTIKDRNSLDLTEAEDIKRWHEYTEELKKIFTTQVITMVWSLTQSQTSWNVTSSGP